jgi:hypothetical protein
VVRDLFLAYLAQHDDDGWLRVIDRLDRTIHPVDRAATRIWFHFYPLRLQRVMDRPDAAGLARQMTLAGRWRLADQIDQSHWFLYGHRHWDAARHAVLEYAAGAHPGSLDLGAQIQEIASRAAAPAGTNPGEVTGIAAIALRTLQQVGPEALAAAPGLTVPAGTYRDRTADDVQARRSVRPGALRRLFGSRDRSMVRFNEREADAQFPIIHTQHLTTAAAGDARDHRSRDPRCSEGPIPVHCRSCSCGTCWVGVLAGADTLSPMDERERAKLAECGVNTEGTAVIRLACMTQAAGPVSLVIPPWNGLVGRIVNRLASQTSLPR